jgi:hypothetical protein
MLDVRRHHRAQGLPRLRPRLLPADNLMPLRRHDLHEGLGEAEFVIAWVSVPDLALHVSPQR